MNVGADYRLPGNGSVKLGNRGILFNNEKHETTRKNCMEAALTASMRRTSHAIFSGHFVLFVVKKYHCHPVTDALHFLILFQGWICFPVL